MHGQEELKGWLMEKLIYFIFTYVFFIKENESIALINVMPLNQNTR